MNKLELSDNVLSCLSKMSEGNPGCLEFLMDVFKNGDIDTFYEMVIRLDDSKLYGAFIYMLWNDCCSRDTYKTIRMIRKLDCDTLRSYVSDTRHRRRYIEDEF